MKMLIAQFKNIFTRFTQHRHLFFLTIILLAVIIRSVYPGNTSFAFDQVQIATAADEIRQGKLTLIGPRTGPADMFTGPLIYYLAAIISFVVASPYAIFITAVFISLCTGLTLYFLVSRYVENQLQLPLMILWAFSPFIIMLDRVPWNPNLTLLSAALVFFPLLKIGKSLTLLDRSLIAAGVFLGFQAHFSGLLLLPIAITILLLFHKNKISGSLFAFGGFVVTILPTIIFDIRHNWLNLNGLLNLASNDSQIGMESLFFQILNKFQIILEVLGRVVFEKTNIFLILIFAAVVVGRHFFLYFKSAEHKQLLMMGGWILSIGVGFAVYKESTPEYYFLILLPVLLLMLAQVLIRSTSDIQRNVLLGAFVCYGCFLTLSTYRNATEFPLGAQLSAASEIEQLVNRQLVSEIVYDIEPIESLGIRYLVDKADWQLQEAGQVVHVVYPFSTDAMYTKKVSEKAGIWIDSRTNPSRRYYTADTFIFSVPSNWKVYESKNNEEIGLFSRAFLLESIAQDETSQHWLYLLSEKKHTELYREWREWHSINDNRYIMFSVEGYAAPVRTLGEHDSIFFLTTLEPDDDSLQLMFN